MQNTIKRLLLSSRPISWLNTAFPFGAAYLVTNGGADMLFWIGTLYFLIPYNLLMYGINDVFDYESDRRNPRKSGIEGVVLEKNLHVVTAVTAISLNIPFVLWLAFQGSVSANIVLTITIFMVLAYSLPILRFKERPVLDSITSSIHFVGPMLYAFSLTGWDEYYLIFVISFFLWGMASHAFGAVQDILPDRKARIASVATFIGARWTVRISIVLYLVACELLFLKGTSPLIAGLFGLVYVANALPFWDITDAKSARVNRGWKRFIKLNYLVGFVITMLLIRAHL
jgi:4-hydroxybenzoate polyprenyltransferase